LLDAGAHYTSPMRASSHRACVFTTHFAPMFTQALKNYLKVVSLEKKELQLAGAV
jgi:hypothetical protein